MRPIERGEVIVLLALFGEVEESSLMDETGVGTGGGERVEYQEQQPSVATPQRTGSRVDRLWPVV